MVSASRWNARKMTLFWTFRHGCKFPGSVAGRRSKDEHVTFVPLFADAYDRGIVPLWLVWKQVVGRIGDTGGTGAEFREVVDDDSLSLPLQP